MLRRKDNGGRTAAVWEMWSVTPAIALVLLPKCPVCLAAWLGLLGTVGSNSLLSAVWGIPLSVGMLGVALRPVVSVAQRTRQPQLLALGLLGAAAVLVARASAAQTLLLCAGLSLLAGALLWSGWLKRRAGHGSAGTIRISTIRSAK